MKRLITICIEKNEKGKRTKIWKTCCLILLSTIFLFSAAAAWAGPVDVNVYAGISDTPGGAPYWDYRGSFSASDVMFATATGFDWHPFGLSRFGADITGILKVDATNAYTFTLYSDDGSMLYIDGSLIINNGGGPPHTNSGTVNLTDGMHPFEVQFYEDGTWQSGVDLYLPAGVSYVPEPTTICLLGLGGLMLRRRQR